MSASQRPSPRSGAQDPPDGGAARARPGVLDRVTTLPSTIGTTAHRALGEVCRLGRVGRDSAGVIGGGA